MHATQPKKGNRTTISLPKLNPSRIARGHAAHRGGAGTHHDQRTQRLRSRGDQRRVALAEA